MAEYYTQFSAELLLPEPYNKTLYNLLCSAAELRYQWTDLHGSEGALCEVLRDRGQLAKHAEGFAEDYPVVEARLEKLDQLMSREHLAEWLEYTIDGDGVGALVKLEEDGGLWLYAEERGEPHTLLPLIHIFLRVNQLPQVFRMEWSYTCSKMRLGGFGGGAGWANRYEHDFISTFNVLEKQSPPDAPLNTSPWSFYTGSEWEIPQVVLDKLPADATLIPYQHMTCDHGWFRYARHQVLAYCPTLYARSNVVLYFEPIHMRWFVLHRESKDQPWHSVLCFTTPDTPPDLRPLLHAISIELRREGYTPPWKRTTP